MSLHVLAIGASRNIGYFSALRLLDAGATVHFLLRSPNVFDDDQVIKRVHRTCGGGMGRSRGKKGRVDVLIFSVGGIPKFDIASLGVSSSSPSSPSSSQQQLRFVVVTSTGITASSRASLPLPIKLLFKTIKQPHRDKVGAERVVRHVAGWDDFDVKDYGGEPGEDVLDVNWRDREGLPEAGSFDNFLVVRPALLTDGECVADKEEKMMKNEAPYRASENELGSYTISRRDTAHFIAQAASSKWSEYGKKIINVGY